MEQREWGKIIDADVLVLGAGAAGCGAAIAAREKGAGVLLVEKGKLESSGCLGGGNDHFMSVLNSGPASDTGQAVVDFYKTPLSGLTGKMIEEGWVRNMPIIMALLQEIGVEFVRQENGEWLRTVGFGQPGNWWMHIRNGVTIKKRLGRRVRRMGVQVMDHVMVTRLLKQDGRIAGCCGFNVLDGAFYVFRAKKVVMALGNTATRAWTNSTGNPYNIWQYPYNTGSYYVLAYDAGVKLMNLDIGQRATLIPKSFGAPGMNGINSMGGHELNGAGERFMGKYDPMWENGKRISQITGTYEELLQGKGPPFYLDMRHLDPKEVAHLQYVLMPGDKATYLDYCEQRGIEFSRDLLEVEISELCFSGGLLTGDNFETNVPGLYNGCVFFAFSGAICGGYYAGSQAAEAARETNTLQEPDEPVILQERARILRPLHTGAGMTYREFEGAVRQVMAYYMGYRRNQKGMETALEKLSFLEGYVDRITASNYREIMKTIESSDLVRMCKLAARASLERKESGRTYYKRSDYPTPVPAFQKPLLLWKEGERQNLAWGF
ncbi:MAG: FAD-binding protein [Desulfobacteraceae bacterium]|nr:MAG: FAD-binding protein [Desulfobacteraceae bacterium]